MISRLLESKVNEGLHYMYIIDIRRFLVTIDLVKTFFCHYFNNYAFGHLSLVNIYIIISVKNINVLNSMIMFDFTYL